VQPVQRLGYSWSTPKFGIRRMLAAGFLKVKTINDLHSCSIDPPE